MKYDNSITLSGKVSGVVVKGMDISFRLNFKSLDYVDKYNWKHFKDSHMVVKGNASKFTVKNGDFITVNGFLSNETHYKPKIRINITFPFIHLTNLIQNNDLKE